MKGKNSFSSLGKYIWYSVAADIAATTAVNILKEESESETQAEPDSESVTEPPAEDELKTRPVRENNSEKIIDHHGAAKSAEPKLVSSGNRSWTLRPKP